MLHAYLGTLPDVHPSVFIAPGAEVVGRVRLAKDSSIWFNAVLRGDVNRIEIGEATNIQDGSIVHVDNDNPCLISDHVHVGHHVNLHGCVVRRGAMVGIGAIVLSGAEIGEESIIGAGSVILEGAKVPPRSLVVGTPGRVVRPVTDEDLKYVRRWVQKYVELARDYRGKG